MAEAGKLIEINDRKVKKLPDNASGILKDDGRQHVIIIGSKGIPALYGGFETFVEKLTAYRESDRICYHVSRMATDRVRYEYNKAQCFDVKVPPIGGARAVWYDIAALQAGIRWCQRNYGIEKPVFYILACRIGPFIGYFKKKIEKTGGVLYINPDGHEWKRRKWNRVIRLYWKLSERLMVKHGDLMICDSAHIEKYIHREYAIFHPRTVFIAYGGDNKTPVSPEGEGKYIKWLKKMHVCSGNYYLAVSRFVPENNFEIMIREFMNSGSKRDFVIITTSNDRFYNKLEKRLHFSRDKRIKFADTVYDMELLTEIRENAYAYLHGHEVGGTNPSLLEALESTNINLLLDVKFNCEVAESAALFWTKEKGNLAALIDRADRMKAEEIFEMGAKAKERIREAYQWKDIVAKYEKLFLSHDKKCI